MVRRITWGVGGYLLLYAGLFLLLLILPPRIEPSPIHVVFFWGIIAAGMIAGGVIALGSAIFPDADSRGYRLTWRAARLVVIIIFLALALGCYLDHAARHKRAQGVQHHEIVEVPERLIPALDGHSAGS